MSRRVALATLTLNAGVSTLPVVIVAYISDVIASCLQSIGRMNDVGDQLQVTVVDNSWTGNSAYGLVFDECPRVQGVDDHTNGGDGQRNNAGAQPSTRVHWLLLNPDIELVEPLFSSAISGFKIQDELLSFFCLARRYM